MASAMALIGRPTVMWMIGSDTVSMRIAATPVAMRMWNDAAWVATATDAPSSAELAMSCTAA